KDNKPAEYSKDNVPYKPKYVIPITLKGVEKDDFTMVYGFPGRTAEYLTSYGVDLIMNQSDPDKVKIRNVRLNIMDEQMKKSDQVRIQYAAKYSGISNYYKKWQGEINGLKKADAIAKKRAFEQEFLHKLSADQSAAKKYGNLLPEFEQKYILFRSLNKQRDYYAEAVLGIEAISYATGFIDVVEGLNKGKKQEELQKNIDKLRSGAPGFFKNYDKTTDKKIAAALLKLVYQDIRKEQQPLIFKTIEKEYNGNIEKYVNSIYSKSVFVSQEKVNKALENIGKKYRKIKKDPVYQLMLSCYNQYANEIRPQYTEVDNEITQLSRHYMAAMRELVTTRKYYPDANSTLRLAYGKVEGYHPRDAVFYDYYTTLSGIMEKEEPASDEFYVDPKLKALYLKKDYGAYADKTGELRVAFCASNHTTGGNSGSPVLNAYGELVGTNFDRDWEGTMSDIFYDPALVRNIVLDIRYTLFVIDKFAGAGYLLNEMKISR
ncbi:MAG TPA: S46 family peptidase, partial [Chitinophagales bacterium]|nr:S46 family peptidase [Chitinophagales bacterium]